MTCTILHNNNCLSKMVAGLISPLHKLMLPLMGTSKPFHSMNANCRHGIFKYNSVSNGRWLPEPVQSKWRITSCIDALRSSLYIRSELWNCVVNSDPGVLDFLDLYTVKARVCLDMNDCFLYYTVLDMLYLFVYIPLPSLALFSISSFSVHI